MRLGIMGAGAVGGYLAARLAGAGHDLTLVARPAVAEGLRRTGLVASDHSGARVVVPPERLHVATEAGALADQALVLLTVKAGSVESAARELAPVLAPGAELVCLQNGVRSAERARAILTQGTVREGMVPFNVAHTADGRLHQGTSGRLLLERAPGARTAELAQALSAAGVRAATHRDLRGILHGKLLFNLNNALNALSGLPLSRQLADGAFRRLAADVIAEGLLVLAAAGRRARGNGPLHPGLAARVLRLPDMLFSRISRLLVRVDEEATSSMAQDLRAGRRTEVDELNGEIVRLGEAHGVPAPLNARIVGLIHAAEAAGAGPPRLTAAAIRGGHRP